MRVTLIGVLAALVLLVAGCGSDDPELSAQCLGAMQRAAQETDIEKADPLIIETLDACGSPEEWLAALREHPGALGIKDASFVSDRDLEIACDGHEQTAVCSAR